MDKQFFLRALVLAILLCVSSASVRAQSSEFEKVFNQGVERLHDGRLREAATAFSLALEMDPQSAGAHLNLGLVRLQQGEVESGIEHLERAVGLKPTLRGAHLFLGIGRYRTNDYAAAKAALESELKLNPANADALMWLGVVELAQGNTIEALRALDKAADLKPGDVDILYHRGRAHMLLSKESYEQMFKVDPKSWRVHQVLAQSFTEADRLQEAISECQSAIELRPNEPGLHEQLGDIYWKQNALESAEAEFEKELEVDPRSMSATYKLAVISLERSKPAVAAALLKKVLEHSPDSPEAHYQMGRAMVQTEQNQAALQDFLFVVKGHGAEQADPEILQQSYYQLAHLYRRLEKPAEAQEAMQSFVRLKQEADSQRDRKLQDRLAQQNPGTPR